MGWWLRWRIEGRVAGAATLVYARRMATIAVDTLRLARRLEAAGFPTTQGQGAAQAIAHAHTAGDATRSDQREVELRLSGRIEETRLSLDRRIEETRLSLDRRIEAE